MYSNLKLQDCLVRFFVLSKRWSLLERRKNRVEPSRTTENLKKNFNLNFKGSFGLSKIGLIFQKSGTLSKNKTKMGQCLTIRDRTGGSSGARLRLGGMAPPLF